MAKSYRGNQYIITESGSPFANYALVSTGDFVTITYPFATLPTVIKSTFNDKKDKPSYQDEANTTFYFLRGGKREGSFDAEIKNQDVDSKQFYTEHEGEVHCIVKQEHNVPDADGKYQFRIMPNCLVVSEFAHSAPGSDYKLQWKVQPTQALMTVNLALVSGACTGMDKVLTCATLAIPAGTMSILYRE
jgi:hypothetical protein